MAPSYRNIKNRLIDFMFNKRNINLLAAKTVSSKKVNNYILSGNGKTIHTVLFHKDYTYSFL